MVKIPFSVYDVFAVLAPGLIVIAAADWLLGAGWISDGLGVQSLVLIALAYVLGHLLAGLSWFFIEELFVGRVLGRPSLHLFSDEPSRLRKMILPAYHRRLPPETRERIRERAGAEGFSAAGEALFLHAFGRVKRDPQTMSRLHAFVTQYGFCRNMAFALLLVSFAYGLAAPVVGRASVAAWAAASLVGGVSLLYRYLGFYRQYSYEVFVSYAELRAGE